VDSSKEFEFMRGQPRLNRIHVHRKQRVVTMQTSVIDGPCQLNPFAWTLEGHLEN
jgi:hypothetical protein